MRSAILLWLLASPSIALGQAEASAPKPERRLVDRVVAVVNREPLLLSQLELEARVTLISQGATSAATSELTETDLASALDYAIGQRLANTEAERLQVFAADDEEVLRALASLASRFASPADFRTFLSAREASEEQLAAIVRRQLRVTRYLDSRVKVAARVSEEELKRYFQDHPADFDGQAFPQVRESIRTALVRDRYRVLAKKQLDDLRARAEVRVLARFEASKPKPTASGPGGFGSKP